jgi:hypothetical protein
MPKQLALLTESKTSEGTDRVRREILRDNKGFQSAAEKPTTYSTAGAEDEND